MVRDLQPIEWHPACGIESDFARTLWGAGLHPYIYDINIIKEAPDTVAELITVTGTVTCCNIAYGGTYKNVDIIGISTDDKSAAGGHVRKVKTWGITRYSNFVVEEVAMSGTTVTSCTNTYLANNTLWASLHGTGGEDAKLAIHLGVKGKHTNEILEIPADGNLSVSARTYIPKNWRCKIDKVLFHETDKNVGLSKVVVQIGASLYPMYDDRDIAATPTDEDIVERWHAHAFSPTEFKPLGRVYGADNTLTKLSFYHGTDSTDVNADFYTGIRLVLWPTRHLASGQSTGIVGL